MGLRRHPSVRADIWPISLMSGSGIQLRDQGRIAVALPSQGNRTAESVVVGCRAETGQTTVNEEIRAASVVAAGTAVRTRTGHGNPDIVPCRTIGHVDRSQAGAIPWRPRQTRICVAGETPAERRGKSPSSCRELCWATRENDLERLASAFDEAPDDPKTTVEGRLVLVRDERVTLPGPTRRRLSPVAAIKRRWAFLSNGRGSRGLKRAPNRESRR